MPLKPCTGCLNLIEKTLLTSGRCRTCQAEHERQRGTRRQRGIGPNHEALARLIKENPNTYACNICLGPPTEDDPLTVGHVVSRVRCLATGKDPDDPRNLQPEHRSCNLRKGSHG